MKNPVVTIDTSLIYDKASFHSVFNKAFGFPSFYGNNMDAWIDCMTSLDDPDARMTTLHVNPGHVVVLHLTEVKEFSKRCPEQYKAIIQGVAFVNWRRIEMGEEPALSLSFDTRQFQ